MRASCRPLPLALVAALLAATACAPDTAQRERPNVVVIVLDTLRLDHVDPFRGPDRRAVEATPFLTELAARSLVFPRAISTSSCTAPATASLLTGLYPTQHGVTTGLMAQTHRARTANETLTLVGIPGAAATLAERLGAAGYATFGFASNINIGPELGFDRGFDVFENDYEQPAERLVARVLERREELVEPYFLYLHLNDVHTPNLGRAEWGYEPVGDALEDRIARYDSELRYLDHWLAELFGAMDWGDETLVVVATDHGEEFRDHGGLGHKFSLYAELNRVLLMLSGAGIAPGEAEANASLVDVLPTLLEATGLGAPEDLPGRSLLRPAELGERALFAHRLRHGRPGDSDPPAKWAVLVGRWKLIHDDGTGSRELYDTHADPREERDLAAERPDVVRALEERMASFRSAATPSTSEVEITLDAVQLEHLRELGYVGED